MNLIRQNIFGFIFIATLVIISIIINKILSFNNILISSAFICILLGLFLGNTFNLSKKIDWFVNFSLKKILRIGIAFLGFSLSLTELFNYGSISLLLVVFNIIIAFIILNYLCKFFGIPNSLGYLITMGTCICGVTAVIATSSIIKSNKDETSYAVGIVTLFGMIAVFTYPYLAHYLFGSTPELAGVFLGTAIHDTAQVSAAGVIYSEMYDSEVALNSSMTTKLLRNSFLILLIPLISYLYNKDKNVNIKGSIKDFFPFFVVGFILCSLLRTIGDELIADVIFLYWEQYLVIIKDVSKYCILFAMAALGLQTNLKSMSKLGIKPLAIGFTASASVGILSVIYLKMI
jgi:uncharacterized integral membrane protein (TIGR00698 family)